MTTLLPGVPMLSAFMLASLVLAVTPGPGVFYIVTRSLSEGRRAGLASVLGVALGNLGNAVGAWAGLAAVFASSALVFDLVRYVGAAYLVYLGCKAIRRKPAPPAAARSRTPSASGAVVRDGFLVALLNPKTVLFFAAFLPQFVTTEVSHPLQPVALGALFVAIAAATDTLYAIFAGLAAPVFARARVMVPMARYLTGGAYLGLGLLSAATGIRSER